MTRRERPHLILDLEGGLQMVAIYPSHLSLPGNPTHLINAVQYGTGKIPTEVGDNGALDFMGNLRQLDLTNIRRGRQFHNDTEGGPCLIPSTRIFIGTLRLSYLQMWIRS